MTQTRAHLFRMDLPNGPCPSGLRAKDLLTQHGIPFEDHTFTTRAEVDAFKAKHGVATTPQIWMDGKRIGGFDALQDHLGIDANPRSYRPVIYLFAVAALLALGVTWLVTERLLAWRTIGWFISLSMVLLGLQKLRDIDGFAAMFRTYDLLAGPVPVYGKIYPFLETGAGLMMFAGVMTWLAAPVALIFGGIGAISVYKAVYMDDRDLACACTGGGTNVPLGPVSLAENVMMVAMALWMLVFG